MTLPDPRTRFQRCLIGGMLGDAWGRPYEGRRVPDRRDFPARPAISDDTQLTLATCEAIIGRNGSVSPEAIAERFRAWFESGRLAGLGSSTLKALRDLSAGNHWALSGARGEFAAGAGAAMRAAPLAFFLDPSRDADRRTIRDVSRITHHNDEAYAGSLAIIGAIRHCARSHAVPPDLLRAVAPLLPDTVVRDRLRALDATDVSAIPLEREVSGHVADAVPAALALARAHPDSLEAVIGAAISVGGDADTVASLAGQIVGSAGAEAPMDLVASIPGSPAAVAIIDRAALLIT